MCGQVVGGGGGGERRIPELIKSTDGEEVVEEGPVLVCSIRKHK